LHFHDARPTTRTVSKIGALPLNNVQLRPPVFPPSLYQPRVPPILQTVQATKKIEVVDTPPEEATLDQEGRDPGISDAMWEKLQRDKQVAEEALRRSDEAMEIFEHEERARAEQVKAIKKRWKPRLTVTMKSWTN
jgi:hypothetical protein